MPIPYSTFVVQSVLFKGSQAIEQRLLRLPTPAIAAADAAFRPRDKPTIGAHVPADIRGVARGDKDTGRNCLE
jgi:hypothetical protein